MTESQPSRRALRIGIGLSSAAVCGGGLCVLICWAAGRWTFGALGREYIPMAPLTAGLLAMLGAGLFLHFWRPDSAGAGVAASVGGAVAAAGGTAVCIQWMFEFRLPLGEWLSPAEMMPGGVVLGKMAPLTGVLVALAGYALLLEAKPLGRFRWCRQAACVPAPVVLGVCLVVLLGYAIDASLLYDAQVVPLALPTAVSLAALSVGLLAGAGTDICPVSLLMSLWAPTPGVPRFRLLGGPVALTLLLAGTSGTVGLLYLRHQIAQARQGSYKELLAVADLKAQQIAQWRDQRLREAMAALAVPEISRSIQALKARGPGADKARRDLWALVSSTRATFRHARVLLLDAELNVLMAAPLGQDGVGPDVRQYAARALQAREIAIGDLHQSVSPPGAVNMNILVPVLGPPGPQAGERLALLVFEIDPHQFLYPALASWPVPSQTAEAFLVRREGNDLVHLSPLRHRPGEPLLWRHRHPEDICSLEARAFDGAIGLLEGIDYRRERVLGVVRPIPGSPWFLVAKMDWGEVHAPLRQRALAGGVLALLLMLAGLLAVAFLQRRRDAQWLCRQLVAEQALRDSRQRFATLFEAMTEGVALHELVLDAGGTPVDYRVMDVNGSFVAHTGIARESAVGALASRLYGTGAPPYLEVYARVVRTGMPETFENCFAPLGKHFRVTAFSPASGWFATVFDDTTDRKRLEAQLLQSQKMEAVGQLAGGIAHDFRNQLTIVRGYTDMLLRRDLVAPAGRDKLREVIRAVDRSTQLTSQLLAFSRRQYLQTEVTDLVALVAEVARSLPAMLGEDVRVRIVPASDPCPVRIDAGQFHQAIVNLVVNARDAMPGGGDLTIETARVELSGEFLRAHPEAAPGPHVRVGVSDTGEGMSEATLNHLFEPFFTTKPVGEGTGLGLAMVYGFVKQSGGIIEVDSRPGSGSRFGLYFPLAGSHLPPTPATPSGDLPRGHETILVVEDEPAVRHMVVESLREAGYDVREAPDARQGLDLAIRNEGAFSLLVTDVVMPGLNGVELAGEIRRLRPDLPVIFLSGYPDAELIRRGLDPSSGHILLKPCGHDQLLHAVRAVLDAH